MDRLTSEFTENTGTTYIYPDLYMALTGAFGNVVMTQGSFKCIKSAKFVFYPKEYTKTDKFELT